MKPARARRACTHTASANVPAQRAAGFFRRMPMADGRSTTSPERTLAGYLLVLLFACVCLCTLISQRLRIARCGGSISRLHQESIKLRAQHYRLGLRVAEQESYERLRTRAEAMAIELVPPEQADNDTASPD